MLLSNGSDSTLITDCDFATQLQHLANNRMSPGSTPKDLELNDVVNIQNIYEHLQHFTGEAMVNLQITGTYRLTKAQNPVEMKICQPLAMKAQCMTLT